VQVAAAAATWETKLLQRRAVQDATVAMTWETKLLQRRAVKNATFFRGVGMRNHINKQLNCDGMDNRGFSLIEVLVAMIILAIMTYPMLTTFATSAKVNATARKVEEANAIGQKVIERCKALSIDELLDGNGDTVTGNAPAATNPVTYGAALTINNSSTGVYDAKAAQILSTGEYIYNMNMASYSGLSVNKDSAGNICYVGSNGINYYVEATLSPNEGDVDGTGTGTEWAVNDYSMPAYGEIKDSSNYVIMEEIYKYDTSIKSILKSRSSVVNPASTDARGNLVAREQTTYETNISKLSGIKKVVVLDINVELDATTNKYNEQPVLYVKYYREKNASGDVQITVNDDGDLIWEEDGSKIEGTDTSKDVYISKTTLAETRDVDLSTGSFKDIYLFYTSYDRKYNPSGSTINGGTSSDCVYINWNKSGGGNFPDGKELNVFVVEQYVATNDSAIEDRSAFKDNVQVKLSTAKVYIDGTAADGINKLNYMNNLNVYSDVNGWSSGGEANNITQNYSEDEERYLYTITVKIWVEQSGKSIDQIKSESPYLTLTSTKENEVAR